MRAILDFKPVVRVAVLIALAASGACAVDVMENVAGTAVPGYSGDTGPATSAKINGPVLMCKDAGGNLYFTDNSNNVVRRIDAATNVITTVAGNGTSGFSGDTGLATSAQLNSPIGIAFDAA